MVNVCDVQSSLVASKMQNPRIIDIMWGADEEGQPHLPYVYNTGAGVPSGVPGVAGAPSQTTQQPAPANIWAAHIPAGQVPQASAGSSSTHDPWHWDGGVIPFSALPKAGGQAASLASQLQQRNP